MNATTPSGSRYPRLRGRTTSWLAASMLAGMAMAHPVAAFAPPRALDQVMALLAKRKHGEVQFSQTDTLAILDRPLKSTGVLVYDAPDHLEKRTLAPKAQSLVLNGDVLTVQREHRTYHLRLREYPQVAPLVDAVRDTLAGDEAALERVFEVTFTGTPQSWRLQLTPSSEALAHHVRCVTISGQRAEIRSVEILEANGDRSLMTLAPP